MSASPKIFLTASAVAALALSSPVSAQQVKLVSRAVAPVSIVRDGPDIPTMDEARQMLIAGRWKDARSAFGTIADNARIRGEYPREPLEELANLKYMMEDVHGAAQAFDELAGQAEIFSDPATELDARFKSALLFQESHDKRAVAQQLPRIRQLLKSPVIAAETKAAIAKRIPA